MAGTFEDFLAKVDPRYEGFAKDVHLSLLKEGYKAKTELKANGYSVSYSDPKTKRSLLNFLFRKNELMIRIYADNLNKYDELLEELPDSMVDEIIGSQVCKRLIDPDDCWDSCVTGYDFYIRDEHYQKCRYRCFIFLVNEESIPVLLRFVENECKMRRS